MARKAKVVEAPAVETAAPVVEIKLSWMDKLLLSENGRKLARPMSEDEKRTATSAVLTGSSILIAGPLAGSLIAVSGTAIAGDSTKANWQGVGGTACAAIALAAGGIGAIGAAVGGLATTGIGMIANRLRTLPTE